MALKSSRDPSSAADQKGRGQAVHKRQEVPVGNSLIGTLRSSIGKCFLVYGESSDICLCLGTKRTLELDDRSCLCCLAGVSSECKYAGCLDGCA